MVLALDIFACQKGHINTIKYLVEQEANINSVNNKCCWTSLITTCL